MYLKPGDFSPKQLSKVAGQLSFMHLAIGPLVRLFNRNIDHFIEKRVPWYEQKIVCKNMKEELKFWRKNINIYNGYTFKPRPLTSCFLFTDASDEGYGKFVLKYLKNEICPAKFDEYEKETSSTFRELLAVKYILTSFGYTLKNQSDQVNIDNSSACWSLSIGF